MSPAALSALKHNMYGAFNTKTRETVKTAQKVFMTLNLHGSALG